MISFRLLLLFFSANLIEKNENNTHIKDRNKASKTPKSSTGKNTEPSSTENKKAIKKAFDTK